MMQGGVVSVHSQPPALEVKSRHDSPTVLASLMPKGFGSGLTEVVPCFDG